MEEGRRGEGGRLLAGKTLRVGNSELPGSENGSDKGGRGENRMCLAFGGRGR